MVKNKGKKQAHQWETEKSKKETETLVDKLINGLTVIVQMALAGLLYIFTIYIIGLVSVSVIDRMIALTADMEDGIAFDPVTFLIVLSSGTAIVIGAVVMKVKYYTWIKQLTHKINRKTKK